MDKSGEKNMKKITLIILVMITVFSCEKSTDTGRSVNTSFNRKILDGYLVQSIAFDSKGNAWISTYSQGLIKYNPNETIVFDSTNSLITSKTHLLDIAIDSKDNIWVGSYEGLIKYDGKSFTRFNSSNLPISNDFIWHIAADSKDNIWISCVNDLLKYDGTSFVVYPLTKYIPEPAIHGIAVDKEDNVWLTSSFHIDDCSLIKVVDGTFTVYSKKELGFSPYYLGGIAINSENQPYFVISYIWGDPLSDQRPQLFTFDGTKSTQFQIDKESVPWSVMIDNEDNIWCYGLFGFLAIYNGQNWISSYTKFKDLGISTIKQSPDNHIWVGTSYGIYIND
jgi:ligand-binding sensor domain-containing protein